MFFISRQTDYALLTLALLKGEKNFVSVSELISKTQMPQKYLARITAELVNAGILASKEGRNGGYKLRADLKKVSLYSFLRIFEQDIELLGCGKRGGNCTYEKICTHRSFFRNKLYGAIIAKLKEWSLSDILIDSNGKS